MTKAFTSLPEGYQELLRLDLQKDKKKFLLVNGLGILIFVLLAVPMHFYVSFFSLFSMEEGLLDYSLRFLVLAVGMVVYLVLHELVHGVAMKLCGTKKVKYGFTGVYAFAGSSDYYDKKSYLFIALAPVVLWGVVIGVVNAFVPEQWFWTVYMIQLMNLSGAAGDLYVTVKFLGLPKDILVTDCGVAMTVYSQSYGKG